MDPATTEFDPAEYLGNGEAIAAYLTEALDHEDARGVVDALGDVGRARGGVERIAPETSIPEATLVAALQTSGPPDFDATLKVIHGLGVRLSASQVA